MRIAYFSPVWPKKTGIATYSRYLTAALGARAEVHLFDAHLPEGRPPGLPAFDIARAPECLATLEGYDACVYHLGNNPEFHLPIYQTLLRHPGIVVLHDTVLYFLMAGQGPGGLARELAVNLGPRGLGELAAIRRDCVEGNLLRYRYPQRFPLLRRVLDHATAIIVHSDTSRRQLLELGYRGPVHTVEHLTYPHEAARLIPEQAAGLRASLGFRPEDVVIGSFGFIGPPKRLHSALAAFDRVRGSLPVKFLVVGEGDDASFKAEVRKRKLEDRVVQLGFVTEEDFERHLAITDVLVNLRYPSMGETSGTLIQAFSLARPCVVTDHAWFAELPSHILCKVPHDHTEIDRLTAALTELAADPGRRAELGNAAREYVRAHCSPEAVAASYLEVVRTACASGPAPAGGGDPPRLDEPAWAQSYLLERTRRALPAAA